MSRLLGFVVGSAALVAVLLGAASCFVPAQSRFPPDVASALRDRDMRRMETQSLILYYPADREELALRVATRVEGCTDYLVKRARVHNDYADQKMVLVLPEVPFNNAFVVPPLAGLEPISVIPIGNTLDFASELGVPPDPSFIGCHEIVHYVQTLQVAGSWGFFNKLFGHVLSPQIGIDAWFHEGIATYYESVLQPGTGRMAWPVWRGMFHAAVAGRSLNGGDLSAANRPFHWGNHYLIGSHFVSWFAGRYGEEALWKVIQRQAGSFFFPLLTALRWDHVDKTLPTLIDEFERHVAAQYPVRQPPPEQRTVRGAGTSARYAVAATGREALIVKSGDLPTRLRIYDGDQMIRDRALTEIVPPRTLAIADPILTSGLSFTADGGQLFFVALDLGQTIQEARLLRYDVDADQLSVALPRIGGPGGSISPDGATFYYAYADGDRHHLAALELATGRSKMLRKAGPRTYWGPAKPSPDGRLLAASRFDGKRWRISLLDAATGRTVADVDTQGAVADPSFADDRTVIFLAEHDGRFQVHGYSLDDRAVVRITDAPYLAFAPRAAAGKLRFLDRRGFDWRVAEAPLAALPARTAPADEVPDLPYAGPGGGQVAAPGDDRDGPIDRVPIVASDAPYSQLDHLFYPSLRTVYLLAPQEEVALAGLSMSGGDRLSFHRWSVFGLYDFDGEEISGGFSYANAQLAPLELRVEADQISWREPSDDAMVDGPLRRQRRALVSVGRSFRTTRVDLAAVAVEEQRPDDPLPALRERRLAGPQLDLAYVGAESTAYGGVRRGVSLALSGAYYDDALTSFDDRFVDGRAALALTAPLPLSARHRLSLGLRARALRGLPDGTDLLKVGGDGSFLTVFRESAEPEQDDFDLLVLPPQLEFSEPLRGFEDLRFTTDRIAIGELVYRYPLILDYGWASTAYLLPSWFFRQIDLELFASGATDSFAALEDRYHLAAGTSVALGMTIWVVPLSVRYQLAQRLTDDEALVHTVAIGAGIGF